MTASASPFPALTETDWRKAAEAALKGGSLDKLVSKTSDAIALAPIYQGERGPRALRADAGAWRILARLDHPDAGDANVQALEDLANGADGLQVVFAWALSAHGFGLSKWDSASLHRAFEGVRFAEGAAFELDLGAAAESQAGAFAALVARSGAAVGAAKVAFGLDPLSAALRTGREDRPWPEEGPATAALVASLRGMGFQGPFFAADGRVIHAAGGTPAQELAFALGGALSYLRLMAERGSSLEDARGFIAFRLAADADQFVTLAKFRALRLLWARVEQASGLAPRPIRIHAESAWRMMTARDAYVNVMRAALAAFSAGLGGADSVTLTPFSQTLGLPDAFARRLARNTQLIELRESRLGFVADPAAGAGLFEVLTRELCEKAWGLFQAWERAGGLPQAIRTGAVQALVREAAGALQRDAARLKAPITGVSAHPDLAEAAIDVLPAEPQDLEAPGRVFAKPLSPIRVSEPFERLRSAAETAPKAPRIFLAAMGPLAQHTRRVGFARELFEAGGFEAIVDPGDCSAEESAERFAASGAPFACLCGADEAYAASAAAFAYALKERGAAHIWLAGRPADEASMRAARIDGFIFAGADQVAMLESALRLAGASL